MIAWILDQLFGRKLERRTHAYLESVRRIANHGSQRVVNNVVRSGSRNSVLLGETMSGDAVTMSLEDVLGSHAMVTGGTGAGKTRFALLILKSVLDCLPASHKLGFCVLDPKGETFAGALYLVKRRLAELGSAEAYDLKKRIVVIDFSSSDPLSSYNILARWPGADADFFAGSRADVLLDLLPGGDGLSLGGSSLLRKAVLLLSEFSLPIAWLEEFFCNETFRGKLLSYSVNADAVGYFRRQYSSVPKQTIAALVRRMEALFSSDALRSVLAGQSAPDFKGLLDDGKVVLINCGGPSLSRSVRRVLQALVVSDFCQAVFSREQRDVSYLLVPDEAQNFFGAERLRDQLTDFLCMSRSFGVHAMFLTQSMGAAVQDAHALNTLRTNIRWSFAMRGEPSDAAHLKGALPVTGRRQRPRLSPYEELSFHTLSEERSILLDGIASLPDRTGYVWFKSRSPEAMLMKTADLHIPGGSALEREIVALRGDPSFGMRQSRKEYDKIALERNRKWCKDDAGVDVSASLEGLYRRKRGEEWWETQ